MNYFIASGAGQQGPFTIEQLRGMGVRPETMVWAEGMPQWVPASQVAELQPLLSAGTASPGGVAAPMGYVPPQVGYAGPPAPNPSEAGSKKIAAGLCGILLGGLGIHKFILGYTVPGIILLLITLLTCGFGAIISHVIGIVEGIIYLTKSDDAFYRTYMIGRREWF
jgi:TM2 domain-containing membrane protein YozV